MRATPEELIEDLRDLARAGLLGDVRLQDMCEWEAADFIAAALPVLSRLAERPDDLGLLARSLLEGDYPLVGSS